MGSRINSLQVGVKKFNETDFSPSKRNVTQHIQRARPSTNGSSLLRLSKADYSKACAAQGSSQSAIGLATPTAISMSIDQACFSNFP